MSRVKRPALDNFTHPMRQATGLMMVEAMFSYVANQPAARIEPIDAADSLVGYAQVEVLFHPHEFVGLADFGWRPSRRHRLRLLSAADLAAIYWVIVCAWIIEADIVYLSHGELSERYRNLRSFHKPHAAHVSAMIAALVALDVVEIGRRHAPRSGKPYGYRVNAHAFNRMNHHYDRWRNLRSNRYVLPRDPSPLPFLDVVQLRL